MKFKVWFSYLTYVACISWFILSLSDLILKTHIYRIIHPYLLVVVAMALTNQIMELKSKKKKSQD
jgi:hypothetical protein